MTIKLSPIVSKAKPNGRPQTNFGSFSWGGQIEYQAGTNDRLTMMYEAVRGALVADDAVERQGGDPKFKV